MLRSTVDLAYARREQFGTLALCLPWQMRPIRDLFALRTSGLIAVGLAGNFDGLAQFLLHVNKFGRIQRPIGNITLGAERLGDISS
jgi:hypothetical protein